MKNNEPLLNAAGAHQRATTTNIPTLSPDAQTRDDGAISLGILLLEVLQEAPPLADHLEEAAAGMVIFGVNLEVLGQFVDAFGEKGDLYLR